MDNSVKLKGVLLSNALFSFVSGLTLILANEFFSRQMGIENDLVLYIIGGGLIFFSAFVTYIARKKITYKKQVMSITIADFAWVLGSIVIIVLSLFNLTQLGYLLVGLIAVIVFLFGVLQLKFNR